MKLRHSAPIPLGHIAHAELGIFPLLDSDGVIEALPQQPVIGLRFIRRCHLEISQRADDSLSCGIKQGFMVGAVVDEEFFVLIPGAEVASENGQHPVFRFNLAAQHPAKLRKADKTL